MYINQDIKMLNYRRQLQEHRVFLHLHKQSREKVLRNFESEMNRALGDRFSQSQLKRELMEKMFHPSNMHKFEGWGFGLDD